MAILELKDVTKKFGGLTAVDGVNLKVEENQICALIGPNGAGKTTVFNMITGAYQVTSGDVIFNGESICGKKPRKRALPVLSRISACSSLPQCWKTS